MAESGYNLRKRKSQVALNGDTETKAPNGPSKSPSGAVAERKSNGVAQPRDQQELQKGVFNPDVRRLS